MEKVWAEDCERESLSKSLLSLHNEYFLSSTETCMHSMKGRFSFHVIGNYSLTRHCQPKFVEKFLYKHDIVQSIKHIAFAYIAYIISSIG